MIDALVDDMKEKTHTHTSNEDNDRDKDEIMFEMNLFFLFLWRRDRPTIGHEKRSLVDYTLFFVTPLAIQSPGYNSMNMKNENELKRSCSQFRMVFLFVWMSQSFCWHDVWFRI